MITFPNAKINLGLDVIGRRSDGYHNLQSVMVPVGWRDILEIVPASGENTTLTVTGNSVNCPAEKNLVMKAYNLMASQVELPPVDIYLRKIIPDGAGLGGGSADAAFTLVMLNSIFALDYSPEQLAELSGTLGSDCPFFIYNRPMAVSGTGTRLSPIDVDLKGLYIVIVKPLVSVSTSEAYRGVKITSPDTSPTEIVSGMNVKLWHSAGLKNDFEESVFALHGEIEAVKNALAESGAVFSSMSGSGSAVYGLFENDIMAENAASQFSGCNVYCGEML